MIIREYKSADCQAVSALFYETVHSVNAKDYTTQQLFAWAKQPDSLAARREDLAAQRTLIAELAHKTVGFGSIDGSGYLDLLFVHKDYQRQGIATALCDELEKGFPVIRTHASITAKPFFEKRGYKIVKAQEVERAGIRLRNFEMIKNGNG